MTTENPQPVSLSECLTRNFSLNRFTPAEFSVPLCRPKSEVSCAVSDTDFSTAVSPSGTDYNSLVDSIVPPLEHKRRKSPSISQEEIKEKYAAKGFATGPWTPEEHQLFVEGLEKYGKKWQKIAFRIRTRSLVQIRSHAQKFFLGLYKKPGPIAADKAQNTREAVVASSTEESLPPLGKLPPLSMVCPFRPTRTEGRVERFIYPGEVIPQLHSLIV